MARTKQTPKRDYYPDTYPDPWSGFRSGRLPGRQAEAAHELAQVLGARALRPVEGHEERRDDPVGVRRRERAPASR